MNPKTRLSLGAILLYAAPCMAQPATKVVVTQSKLVTAPDTVTLVGTLNAVRRSRVSSEVAGVVAEMQVRQGDRVKHGDVLCILNDDTLKWQLEEARSRLGSLKARHAELVKGTRPEELQRLKALVDETTAELDRWQSELSRVESLYEGSRSNEKELYDTRADFRRAQTRNVAANAAYQLGLAGPREEEISRAAFDVAAQESVVKRIERDWEKTRIRAPFSGYAADRAIEIGEWLDAGSEVLEIVDLSTMLARVPAPEHVLPAIDNGSPARVKIDAIGDTLAGTVKHIVRSADSGARTFPIDVEVANDAGRLSAGMFARVTLAAGGKSKIVAVPKDAVVQREGTHYVAVTIPGQDGQMSGMLLPVTPGVDVDDWLTITSGNIAPGTTIITRGNERMLPFPMPVIVVDENGSPVAAGSEGTTP